jgi:hypothetical protein
MLRKYKITYVKVETTREQPNQLSVEIEAASKYDAKKKFYHQHPECEIVRVEVASANTVDNRLARSETAPSKEPAESRLAKAIVGDYATVEDER